MTSTVGTTRTWAWWLLGALVLAGGAPLTYAQVPPPSAAAPAASGALKRAQSLIVGHWVSVATEMRASGLQRQDGAPIPIYLQRDFQAFADNRFELNVVGYADPYGQSPLARLRTQGHLVWRGEHPIGPGAQKVDLVVDLGYEVTPLSQAFADTLNPLAMPGYARWEVGRTQSIFGKDFAPFGMKAGQNVTEHELAYLAHGMLFWGARHIDGRGFDTDANRPTNLQVPLVRK